MNRNIVRAGAYAAAAAFLILAARAWFRPASLGPGAPDVLADASKPVPLPPGAQDAPPAAARPVAHAPGEPLEAEARQADRAAQAASQPGMTNEQLHAALEEEKARMGIKRIVPPRRTPDGQASIPVPAAPPALPGATPALLSQPSAPAPGAKATPDGARDGRLPSAGVIVHSEAERAALWSARSMSAAPPTVDFSRQRLAVVFSEGPRYGVEVAAVQTFSDKVVVQYREPEIPEDAERQTQAPAYQFRVLPLSDKPVIFQKLP